MIGAVVLNYCSAEDTWRAATTLASFAVVEHVVVVDNASPDGSGDLLASRMAAAPHGVELVRSPTNGGYSAGNNLGLRRLAEFGCATAVVSNPDVFLGEQAVSMLVAALRDDLVVVSPLLLLPPDETGRQRVDTCGARWRPRSARGSLRLRGEDPGSSLVGRPTERPHEVVTFTGACFAADLEMLTRLGYLWEGLFLYGEEVDLTRRLRSAGLRVGVVTAATATHDRGASIGSSPSWSGRSLVALTHGTASALVVTRRWWPLYLPGAIAGRLGLAALFLVRLRRDAASAVLRGVWLGLGGATSRR